MNNTVDHLATASRFAIAAAIIYLAYQLGQFGAQLPAAMQSVNTVSQQIEPTLAEVTEIRKEITRVRELIPDVLAEVAEVRRQIPPILTQVEDLVTVVDATQQQFPQILSTADKAIVSLDQTRSDIVPLVPQALEEVRLTRETIDPTLDRVEALVDDAYKKTSGAIESARSAGKEVSEGAVKGFFTGLIKLPFELAGSLAYPIVNGIDTSVAKQLTEKDIELMVQAGERARKSDKLDKKGRWENPESGNSGSVEIIRGFELRGFECIETRLGISNTKNKQIMDKLFEVCRNAEDKWVLAKDLAN